MWAQQQGQQQCQRRPRNSSSRIYRGGHRQTAVFGYVSLCLPFSHLGNEKEEWIPVRHIYAQMSGCSTCSSEHWCETLGKYCGQAAQPHFCSSVGGIAWGKMVQGSACMWHPSLWCPKSHISRLGTISRPFDSLLCESNKAMHTWDISEARDVLALSPWKLREDE